MTDQPCPKCGYPGRFCRCVKGAGDTLVSKEAVLKVVADLAQKSAVWGPGGTHVSFADLRLAIDDLPSEQGEDFDDHELNRQMRVESEIFRVALESIAGPAITILDRAKTIARAALHQEGEA